MRDAPPEEDDTSAGDGRTASAAVEAVARAMYAAFDGKIHLEGDESWGGFVGEYQSGGEPQTTLDGKWDLEAIARVAIAALDAYRCSADVIR